MIIKYHIQRVIATETKSHPAGWLFIGGLEEIRTPDPHNANVVRSQLRYKPISHHELYSWCFCLSRDGGSELCHQLVQFLALFAAQRIFGFGIANGNDQAHSAIQTANFADILIVKPS